MAKLIEPLAPNVPIVDPETGNPTPYFARILRDISDARVTESIIDAMGGDPEEDSVVTWDDSDGDLQFKQAGVVLDQIDDTHGAVLYRDSAEWMALAPGDAGDVLTTNGSGADPTWETPTGAGGGAWDLIDTTGAPITGKTFTITIASPGVATSTAHGYVNNTPVVLSTTGALPTGLSAGTTYFTRNVTANTFELSATSGGASINTTGSQSGVHTVKAAASWVWSANVTNVDFINLSDYSEVLIINRLITLSVSGNCIFRASVNNGSAFFSTSGDYIGVTEAGVESNLNSFSGDHVTATTSARTGGLILRGINIDGPPKFAEIINILSGNRLSYFVASPSPINAMRVLPSAGGNITGGRIQFYAR